MAQREARASAAETILPFRVARPLLPEARFCRSTWLSSSILSLRHHGDYDRYLSLIEPQYLGQILDCGIGKWLPTEVALAHYRACWGLGLTKEEIHRRSLEVTRRVHQSALAHAVRFARDAGVTPWAIYGQLDRLWNRVWQGGGVCVTKHGPKDALIEIAGWPPAREPYCRAAMPAVVVAVSELFCRKAYVADVSRDSASDGMLLRAAWA